MAIRDEKRSSDVILGDALYHRVALLSDPDAAHIAALVEPLENKLREMQQQREQREREEIIAKAKRDMAALQADAELRMTELEVLGAVKKQRGQPAYKACFPNGLVWLVGLRGKRQHEETKLLVAALVREHPAIAKKRKQALLDKSSAALAAEKGHRDAELAVVVATRDEQLVRSELVLQLRRNEGALLSLFASHVRARSFFRKVERQKSTPQPADPVDEP